MGAGADYAYECRQPSGFHFDFDTIVALGGPVLRMLDHSCGLNGLGKSIARLRPQPSRDER
jgi:hypothetical protein